MNKKTNEVKLNEQIVRQLISNNHYSLREFSEKLGFANTYMNQVFGRDKKVRFGVAKVIATELGCPVEMIVLEENNAVIKEENQNCDLGKVVELLEQIVEILKSDR